MTRCGRVRPTPLEGFARGRQRSVGEEGIPRQAGPDPQPASASAPASGSSSSSGSASGSSSAPAKGGAEVTDDATAGEGGYDYASNVDNHRGW